MLLEDEIVVNAGLLRLPLDATREGSDDPTSAVTLDNFYGCEVGVWQMEKGCLDDVEQDEIFIVLSGTATVQIHAENGHQASVLHLVPSSIGRLRAGMKTTWTADSCFRKVYLAPTS